VHPLTHGTRSQIGPFPAPHKKSPVEACQEEAVTSSHLPEFTARFNTPTARWRTDQWWTNEHDRRNRAECEHDLRRPRLSALTRGAEMRLGEHSQPGPLSAGRARAADAVSTKFTPRLLVNSGGRKSVGIVGTDATNAAGFQAQLDGVEAGHVIKPEARSHPDAEAVPPMITHHRDGLDFVP
jgi:hypothetical protein